MKALWDKVKGYKTFVWAIWPSLVAIAVASGQVDAGFQAWVENLVAQYWEWMVAAYGAIAIAIRAVTDSPIFDKKEEEM